MGTERNSGSEPGARPTEMILALTTEASQEQAERLARELLARGLVACVSLLPVVSLYRWQGHPRRDEEVQLLLKTRQPCLTALHQAVLELHSYEIPEWITFRAEAAGAYGQWWADQLLPPSLSRGDASPAPAETPGDGAPIG